MKMFLVACILVLFTLSARAESLRMAVTTSFHNSGLADILLPEIRRDTGLKVQLLVVGTGQALRLGRAGDVDAILVHSRAAEEAFIARGFGDHRREIMYNDFVYLGPAADPAGLRSADSATDALTRIATSGAAFVSRGDDSGTHKKELQLWSEAGRMPADFGRWYKPVGAGMGAALNTAAALDAYILADRASWLNFRNRRGLTLLFAGDRALFNQYTFIPVSRKHHPHVRADAAKTLENWLISDRAKSLINNYQIKGEHLFVFNARQ